VRVVVQQSPQQSDVPGQRVLSDGCISPSRIKQLILGNYAARFAKQAKQHPEGLGLNSQHLPLTLEVKLAFMDFHVGKPENRGVMPVHTSLTPPSEKLQLRKEKLQERFMTVHLPPIRVHAAFPAEVISDV
jgi:hypothetical protein